MGGSEFRLPSPLSLDPDTCTFSEGPSGHKTVILRDFPRELFSLKASSESLGGTGEGAVEGNRSPGGDWKKSACVPCLEGAVSDADQHH